MTRFHIALFALILCGASLARAHGDHGIDADDHQLEATLEALHLALEMHPPPLEPTDRAPVDTIVRVGRTDFYLNDSRFYRLVAQFVRIGHHEIERDCPGCSPFSEDELMRLPEDREFRGFVARKIVEPLADGAESIARLGASVAVESGQAAATGFAASEAAEHFILTKVSAGAVTLCWVNNLAFIVLVPRMQAYYRTMNFSRRFDRGSFMSALRVRRTAKAVRRAFSRVSFEIPPFAVDEHEVAELDEEGPRRFWGIVSEGKRARWIHKIAKRMERVSPEDAEAWRRSLRRATQIHRADYMAPRGRLLYLKLRRNSHPHAMRGKSPMERLLNKTVFWPITIQEGILHRGLIKNQEDWRFVERSYPVDYGPDPVRDGLAREFAQGDPEQAAFLSDLLQDVERIFDSSVDKRIRYWQSEIIEDYINSVLWEWEQTNNQQFSMPAESRSKLVRWAKGLWKDIRKDVTSGGYVGFGQRWARFVHLAAVDRDPSRLLTAKHDAMEGLLRVWKHVADTTPRFRSPGFNPDQWLEETHAANQRLSTFHPWRDKRTHFSWFGLLPKRESLFGFPLLPSRYPWCDDLVKEEH